MELDYAELGAAWRYLGLGRLPTVLAYRDYAEIPAQPRTSGYAADTRLRARGLVDEWGDLDGELAAALRLLASASEEADLRFADSSGREVRALVCRREAASWRVLVDGDQVWLEPVYASSVFAALAGVLPRAERADGWAVRIPTAALRAAGTDAGGPGELREALCAWGVNAAEAGRLVRLFHGRRELFGQVGVAVRDEDGIRARGDRLVHVYDGPNGRVAMYENEEWTVVTPADTGVLARLLSTCVDAARNGDATAGEAPAPASPGGAAASPAAMDLGLSGELDPYQAALRIGRKEEAELARAAVIMRAARPGEVDPVRP